MIDKKSLKKLIEAIIFYEGRPLTIDFISEKLNISNELTWELLQELKKDYIFKDGGILLENNGNNYYFVINSDISEIFKKVYKKNFKRKYKLSHSLMEVLAIVAYKQPITKIEIDKLRGVDSGYSIRRLLELELIKIQGKKDVPGKPSLYITTDNFLRMYGISSIEELPDPEEIDFDNKFFGEEEKDIEN